MKISFKKVKTEHTILSEFLPFLRELEAIEGIQRMIPGRIMRKQKGSSDLRFTISYPTSTGLKAKMSKGATSQELFIITDTSEEIQDQIETLRRTFISG